MSDEDLARLARPLLCEDPDDPSARPIKLYRLRDVTVRGGPAGSLLLLYPHACCRLPCWAGKAQARQAACVEAAAGAALLAFWACNQKPRIILQTANIAVSTTCENSAPQTPHEKARYEMKERQRQRAEKRAEERAERLVAKKKAKAAERARQAREAAKDRLQALGGAGRGRAE